MFNDKHETLNFPVNLSQNFFETLQFDKTSLKSYRVKAAIYTAEAMGNRLALCFSGGVDSQCMVQCFVEANIPFDLYILKFKNQLNVQDFDHAIRYCEKFNLKYNTIELDILSFLNRENYEYALNYSSPSPHFNTHYKLFDILRSRGYDGVIAGGNAFFYSNIDKRFLPNSNKNCFNYITYSIKTGFKCQGNFLSFYPSLAWAISLLSPPLNYKINSALSFNEQERNYWEKVRYTSKVQGYKKAGFDIVPQLQKYTGFELVKKHLEQKTGDGWTFENLYRVPLEKMLPKPYKPAGSFVYQTDKIKDIIESIYRDNFLPGQGSPSGI